MKDSILTARAKRLTLVAAVRLRRLSLKMMPFIVAFWIGVMWGSKLEAARIHEDCKFMNTFRIDYTGYMCKIGRS
jgi:hypothetical protein